MSTLKQLMSDRSQLLRWGLVLTLVILSLFLPQIFADRAHQNLLVLAAIFVILVASLDLLIGNTGLISLGHGGFWAIGAYTSVILTKDLDWPFLVALLAAGGAALLAGVFLGYPSLKLRGHYFVVITFISSIIVNLLINNMQWLTQGPSGIPGVPIPSIEVSGLFSFSIHPLLSKTNYYYLVLVFVFITLACKHFITHSRFGRALTAIKEDQNLAESIGIHTHRYKVIIFAIATGFAGVAGSLYAHYRLLVTPDQFTFVESFDFFVMNLVGGAGTTLGPIVGPTTLILVEELARGLPPQIMPPDIARTISPLFAHIVFGLFLILTIIFLPRGIVGSFNAWRNTRKRATKGGDHDG